MVYSIIYAALFLMSGNPSLAAPGAQNIQRRSTCNDLNEQVRYAVLNEKWEELVRVARDEMTDCKDQMTLDDEVATLFWIVVGLNQQGKYGEALPIARRCIVRKPDHCDCHVGMAADYEGIGDQNEALKSYKMAMEIGGYDTYTSVCVDYAKKRALEITEFLDTKNKKDSDNEEPEKSNFPLRFEGTGFFVTDEGHILTNSHVVSGCSQIYTRDGTLLRLVDSDSEVDLALLKANIMPTAVATFRTGASPRLGDQVITFGFPLQGLLSSAGNLSTGVVAGMSGLGDDQKLIQICAPVQPGNSGGPLLDDSGDVIGVVVAKLDALMIAELTGDIPQNVTFAIRGSEVVRFLDANAISYQKGARRADGPMRMSDIASLAQSMSVQLECVRPSVAPPPV